MACKDEEETLNETTAQGLNREMERLLAEVDPSKYAEAEASLAHAASKLSSSWRKPAAAVHAVTQNMDDLDDATKARFQRNLAHAGKSNKT